MAQLLFIYDQAAAPETYSAIGNFGEPASVVMQGMGGSLIKSEKFENYTEHYKAGSNYDHVIKIDLLNLAHV